MVKTEQNEAEVALVKTATFYTLERAKAGSPSNAALLEKIREIELLAFEANTVSEFQALSVRLIEAVKETKESAPTWAGWTTGISAATSLAMTRATCTAVSRSHASGNTMPGQSKSTICRFGYPSTRRSSRPS